MPFVIQAWQLMVLAIAARLNDEQAKVIAYLRVENRVLREQLTAKDSDSASQTGSAASFGDDDIDHLRSAVEAAPEPEITMPEGDEL